MPECDVIVLGSGPAGVHAAETLLAGGVKVFMIDGGRTGPEMHDAPSQNFLDVRRSNADQWKWFLGKDLSAIGLDGLTGGLGGGQISGNRAYVSDVKPGELPLEVKNGIVVQSLASGGLGAGWGAACALLAPEELKVMGLPDLEKHYEIIGKRIGISGPQTRPWMQPALPLDQHAATAERYAQKNAATLKARRIRASQPHSAILTKDLNGRKASALADMEYWTDPERSVYRPQYTLETLKASPNFTYMPGLLAETISGTPGAMTVVCKKLDDLTTKQSFGAKHVVLACGAVNTARVLLASLGMKNVDVPFLGKPHVFTACVNPHALGTEGSRHRTSLCQYTLLDEEPAYGMPRAFAQLYSYRSMLLFRLLGSIPLPAPDALTVAALLSPSLVIADIRFPITLGNAATLRLTDDGVAIAFPEPSEEERQTRLAAWASIRRALRTVHMFPVKNIPLPEGSTSHYAGTVPNAPKGAYPLTSDDSGRSNELPGVWIADTSAFCAISVKPPTFTLMANAVRVAENILKD